ncbi:MAG: cytosine deaminase [Rhodospirillales bacterium]|nr:cytosine deaminase [Rhodospirillales bacterium]
MPAGFFEPPRAAAYALRHVRVPAALATASAPANADGHLDVDIAITDGRIADIVPVGTIDPSRGPDLRQASVWPTFADVHTHLDKGHIWPRAANPDGTFYGALTTVMADRQKNWSAADIEARFDFALRCAYAHGVSAVRTHLDSFTSQAEISWPVFAKLRDRWAGRIALQASSIVSMDHFGTDDGAKLADLVKRHGGQLGCVTRISGEDHVGIPPDFDAYMERVFELAEERGLDLDLHVDESGDPEARTLVRIARMATARKFRGAILMGHCCSLAVQPDEAIDDALDACVAANVDVVSLPMCNMYLQGRKAGRTPRWRGVTLLHEMKARGMRVAVAGDNVRDPFYAYGDHDMLETFVQAVRIAQLDHPLDDWAKAATTTPADIMKLPATGRVARGLPADLVVLRARSYSELLSRRQADRVVLRDGKAIDTTLPDYRELDRIVGP